MTSEDCATQLVDEWKVKRKIRWLTSDRRATNREKTNILENSSIKRLFNLPTFILITKIVNKVSVLYCQQLLCYY